MLNYFVVLGFVILGFMIIVDKKPTNSQEAMDTNVTVVCYDNVEYIYIQRQKGGLAPHMKTDGSVYTC